MKPAPFSYHRPETLESALQLLAEHGDEAKVLAGGQSLVPMLNMRLARPQALIDVNRLGLGEVVVDNDALSLGALVRHVDLERDPEIAAHAPLLTAAAPLIGHQAIRVRGTIGGSLVHADPAAELPAVAVALDATIHAASTGRERLIPAPEFFDGPFMTALEDDEMVVGVTVPAHGHHRCAYEELAVRAGDFAIAGVAAAIGLDAHDRVDSARIAMSGAGAVPIRARPAEEALAGRRLTDAAIDEAAKAAAAEASPTDDIHGSAAYRRHLVTVLVRRALKQISSQGAASS